MGNQIERMRERRAREREPARQHVRDRAKETRESDRVGFF
jgi:hypothetical protein